MCDYKGLRSEWQFLHIHEGKILTNSEAAKQCEKVS